MKNIFENNKDLQSRKGKTNNPNGRPKGVPNKVTADLRAWIKEIIDNNRATFETDLASVEPQQRLAIMEKLLSYVLPKLATIEIQEEKKENSLEDLLQGLKEKQNEKG